MVIAVSDWHAYAREYGTCFVAMIDNQWVVFLPDWSYVVDDDLDKIRVAASKQGCTILL